MCARQVGKRKTSVTILAGSVVRVWGALEATLARHEHSLSRSDRTMRAVHVSLPDATSLIGGLIPTPGPLSPSLMSQAPRPMPTVSNAVHCTCTC